MSALIAAELRKLLTVRTTWVLSLVGLILVGLGSAVLLFVEELSGPFRGTDPEVAALVHQVGGGSAVVLIVAILLATAEFRHGTIGRTLQITPSRSRVLAAKLSAGALYALGFFLAGLALVTAMGWLGAGMRDTTLALGAETITALWQSPAGLALVALLGVAIGALLRGQVLAITITLVWLFVAENLVVGLAPKVGRWMPFQALNAVFLTEEVMEGVPEGALLRLDPPVALVVFLGYVFAAVVGAGVLLRTRDV